MDLNVTWRPEVDTTVTQLHISNVLCPLTIIVFFLITWSYQDQPQRFKISGTSCSLFSEVLHQSH